MGVVLAKVRYIMNKVVIEWEQKRQYPVKYPLFDSLSFMDQIYRSWLKDLEHHCQKHIHFSENPMPDHTSEEIGNLGIAVSLFT